MHLGIGGSSSAGAHLRMKSSTISSHSHITQLGTTARSCILQGGHGNVLAVVSQAIYLLTESGELLWITPENAPMHRRCVQILMPLPGLSTGSQFRMRDHQLEFDPSIVLDMQNASVWSTPRMQPGQLLDFTQLFSHIQSLFSLLDHSQTRGFGSFLPHILLLSRDTTTQPLPETADPVLSFAGPLVLEMARACLEGRSTLISRSACALIGLGAGLTPSGDDFLGGAFFALVILRAAYPGLFHTDIIAPIDMVRSRTHLISYTLLSDLANGYAVAPLHSVINGILRGEPLEDIVPFIDQLTRLGHSTGWDLLAGMLTGLLITAPGGHLIPSRKRHYLEYGKE